MTDDFEYFLRRYQGARLELLAESLSARMLLVIATILVCLLADPFGLFLAFGSVSAVFLVYIKRRRDLTHEMLAIHNTFDIYAQRKNGGFDIFKQYIEESGELELQPTRFEWWPLKILLKQDAVPFVVVFVTFWVISWTAPLCDRIRALTCCTATG